MLTTLPLLAWGSPDDIGGAGWTMNSCTRTAGIADPFGGTAAVTLDDTSAVAFGTAYKEGILLSSIGQQLLYFMVSPGSTAVAGVQLWDATAGVSRGQLNANISGGAVTSVSAVNGATALGSVDLGGGWYLCLGLSKSDVVPGNSHRYQLYPAISPASATGTATFYLRHLVLVDYIERYTPKRRPRPGYERARAPSLAADSWNYGDEYVRILRLSFVPDALRMQPTPVSGWFGQAESTGLNAGILAMLAAGFDQQDLVFVPDRSACSRNWTGKMERPDRDWAHEDEPNQDRALEIELVGTASLGGY